MNVSTLLRPVRRVATATTVGAVSVTVLVAGGTTAGSAHGDAGAGTVVGAVEERHPTAGTSRSGDSTRFGLVGVSAYPALSTQAYGTKVLAGINRVRARHHLRPVAPAGCAEKVAGSWSMHLAATDDFEHQSMQRLLRTCHARYVGEVLGRGSVSPNRLVRMWLDSPPHRHILMSRAPGHIGIGATPNTRGEWVVAADLMAF